MLEIYIRSVDSVSVSLGTHFDVRWQRLEIVVRRLVVFGVIERIWNFNVSIALSIKLHRRLFRQVNKKHIYNWATASHRVRHAIVYMSNSACKIIGPMHICAPESKLSSTVMN